MRPVCHTFDYGIHKPRDFRIVDFEDAWLVHCVEEAACFGSQSADVGQEDKCMGRTADLAACYEHCRLAVRGDSVGYFARCMAEQGEEAPAILPRDTLPNPELCYLSAR